MSIKGDIKELESIRYEIKVLNEKRKKLKKKEKEVENKIAEYLKTKELPGVKHQGKAIVLEKKETSVRKKTKDGNSDAMDILEKYGIKDSQKVLAELLAARKGNTVVKESLKIKNIKK